MPRRPESRGVHANLEGPRRHLYLCTLEPYMNAFHTCAAFSVASLALIAVTAPVRTDAVAQKESVGSIVYEHAPDGRAPWPTTDIYSVEADGTNNRALTQDGHSHTPSWSPDGKHILFVRDAALTNPPPYRENQESVSHHPIELCLMDRDGSNPRLLRRMELVIFSAAWSPDGKTFVVTWLPEEWLRPPPRVQVAPGLFLISADGRGEPRLLLRDAFAPAWSPDGKKIGFSARLPGSRWAVHISNADGSGEVQLTDPSLYPSAGGPTWSPDGKQITFGSRDAIFLMNADGSGVRQLTTDQNWKCEHPSWSPDGKQIAFFCRAKSAPCGGGIGAGDTGSLSTCIRRLFVMSLGDPRPTMTPLTDHDGAFPVFSPKQ
jgi:Tol biopolymer transport system component